MGGLLVEVLGLLVDRTYMFNQRTLVLEGVTLAQMVEFVVEVLVDFARSAVLDKKAAKDTETTHPDNLAITPSSSASVTVSRSGSQSRGSCRIFLRTVLESYLGIRASAVPFLLPKPRCLPIRLAAVSSRARARECMVTGLRMMRPSETSFRIV